MRTPFGTPPDRGEHEPAEADRRIATFSASPSSGMLAVREPPLNEVGAESTSRSLPRKAQRVRSVGRKPSFTWNEKPAPSHHRIAAPRPGARTGAPDCQRPTRSRRGRKGSRVGASLAPLVSPVCGEFLGSVAPWLVAAKLTAWVVARWSRRRSGGRHTLGGPRAARRGRPFLDRLHAGRRYIQRATALSNRSGMAFGTRRRRLEPSEALRFASGLLSSDLAMPAGAALSEMGRLRSRSGLSTSARPHRSVVGAWRRDSDAGRSSRTSAIL